MTPTVLLFRADLPGGKAYRGLALRHRIRVKIIPESDSSLTLRELLDGKTGGSCVSYLPETVAVFCGFSDGAVSAFLGEARREKLAPVRLRAVLTETNAGWTAEELYAALSSEHDAMQAGGGEKPKPKLAVSACLLGAACRYDGGSKPCEAVLKLHSLFEIVPVCPEALGGLPIPREPAERRGDRVVSRAGADVTEEFLRGAEAALRTAQNAGCRIALLKERSPSCGSGEIYDGTFTKTLLPGEGVAAALFRENGIRVFGESQTEALISFAGKEE